MGNGGVDERWTEVGVAQNMRRVRRKIGKRVEGGRKTERMRISSGRGDGNRQVASE